MERVMTMEGYWKIGDFAKKIGKHVNTVDGWFKKLEEQSLHYVNRASNEKVYDELDLSIAHYIHSKREEKWALEAIFHELKEQFDLRPFPLEDDSTYEAQVLDIEKFKQEITKEMQNAAMEVAATQIADIKEQYQSILNRLPEEKSKQEKDAEKIQERENRINEIVIRKRVERKLEEEAKKIWDKKPESERFKRKGWFQKEEDFHKKEEFIKEYTDTHFEQRLRESFQL